MKALIRSLVVFLGMFCIATVGYAGFAGSGGHGSDGGGFGGHGGDHGFGGSGFGDHGDRGPGPMSHGDHGSMSVSGPIIHGDHGSVSVSGPISHGDHGSVSVSGPIIHGDHGPGPIIHGDHGPVIVDHGGHDHGGFGPRPEHYPFYSERHHHRHDFGPIIPWIIPYYGPDIIVVVETGSLRDKVYYVADEYGWDVVWDVSGDYTWHGRLRMNSPDIRVVIGRLLSNYPLYARFYDDSHTIVIRER